MADATNHQYLLFNLNPHYHPQHYPRRPTTFTLTPPPPHDTRTKICILINVIVPKLEYAGEVWEGREREVRKQLETVQMTAAKHILG